MSLDALIAKIEQRLDSLEPKLASPNAMRELITRLDAKIAEAQEKGYGLAEIVDVVVTCGFEVKRDEFEKHLAQALGSKRKKSPARRGKTRVRKTMPQA